MITVYFFVFPAGNSICLKQTIHHARTSQGRHGYGNAAVERTLWKGICLRDALLPSQTHTQISWPLLFHFSHGDSFLEDPEQAQLLLLQEGRRVLPG